MLKKAEISNHYKERMKEIAESEFEKNQVVLVGDCMIENLDIQKYFVDKIIYNNGISGDTTELLAKSLYKRALKLKPSKLFISIGSNDIGFDQRNVKEIYLNILEMIQEIKTRSKNTEIHIVSVIPVNPANMDRINREYVDSRDNYEISMLNYYLKNYARKNRIKFVDVTKLLKNDFYQLGLDFTTDGFHLNETGYRVVSDLIKQYV
ncbi:MAG: hypothetical protein JXR62_01040 [Bacilli bacterium]|nr:hypothetical protein [Bacilli bacterium]